MKKLLFLILFCSLGLAEVSITGLPAQAGSLVGATDVFPAVDVPNNTTVKVLVSDLFSVPSLASQLALLAPKANPIFTGAIGTPLTVSSALATDSGGNLVASATSATELGYVSGVTSSLQTQINAKLSSLNPVFTGTVTMPTGAGFLRSDGGGVVSSAPISGSDLPLPAVSTLGGVFSKAAVSHNFLTGISSADGSVSQAQPAFTDISGSVAAAQLPNPGASSLGGVQSKASVSHNFLTQISTGGVVSQAQPAFSDISGSVATAQLPLPGVATLGGVFSIAAVSHNFLTQISSVDGSVSQAQPAFTDINGSVAAAQLPNPSSSSLGGVQSAAPVSHQWINTISTSGIPGLSQPAFTDISGSVAASQLPNPGASTLGGVQSLASVSHNFLTQISTSGVVSQAQPAFSDISGSVAAAQLPLPGVASLGGVFSKAVVSHNFLTGISSVDGSVSQAQPAFSDISGSANLTSQVTGTLPVANGGTGIATTTAYGVLAAGTTATGAFQNVGVGTSGQVLTSNGAGSLATWQSLAGTGTVTSVAASVPAFLSISGSPVTTSGTLAISYSGTALPVANGGTGSTTLSSNTVLLGNGTSAVQTVAPSTSGNVLTSNGSTWVSSAPVSGTGTLVYGDGSDGDVTCSGGSTLSRDMYYHNLTISAGCALVSNGYLIFVSGTLDLTSAPAGAITFNGANGPNSTSTGATNPLSTNTDGHTIAAGLSGKQGGAGVTGSSGSGATSTGQNASNGGVTGGSGKSGNGTGGSAGSAGSGNSPSFTVSLHRYEVTFSVGQTGSTQTMQRIGAGFGGGSSAGGAGDGSNLGGGAGPGGNGGGAVAIYANAISRGGSTTAGCISALGGNGGNGFSPVTGTVGGGGGGAAGGGGWVYIAYGTISGSTGTNAIDVSGGTGGTGGTAPNSGGTGGSGGAGGGGGTVIIYNVGAGTVTQTNGAAGSSGSANSGLNGGSGGSGNTFKVSL